MRCFYHGDVEAVAVCKSCGHGVCHDCCTEVGTSAACRNRCESDVAGLNEIIERNKTVYGKTSGIYVRNGFFFLLLGLVFAGFGLAMHGDGSFQMFPVVLGGIFFLYGMTSFFTARRFRSK